jgi:hypothetical protein
VSDDETERRKAGFAASARTIQSVATRLVGLDEDTAAAAAAERGCDFRVVRRDRVVLPVTMDLRSNRINATVVNGRVTAVEVG